MLLNKMLTFLVFLMRIVETLSAKADTARANIIAITKY